MKQYIWLSLLLFICPFSFLNAQNAENANPLCLIAHRGGVVDSITPENSKEALLKAVEKNYCMVEVDVRLTKDGVLISHHDRDFNKYYHTGKKVVEMTWDEISWLVSDMGTSVQRLEDVFILCREKGLNVMIDNKMEGFDPLVCQQVIELLDKYNLRKNALMIGTSASTEFFTGKVRLSCTRQQLVANMERPDYSPDNYYYFGNPSAEDAKWARKNNILIVGVINEWAIPRDKEKEVVQRMVNRLKALKIKYIQIDSKYDVYF